MEGYSDVFNKSVQTFNRMTLTKEVFERFRSEHELYGFIDNGDHPPDVEADNIAKHTNRPMYEMYKELLVSRRKLGYANSTSVYSDYTCLDSRHIMMFVILFTHLPHPLDSIVEIGGGFGHWLTLNKHRPLRKWTMIDLPHLSLLQRWYLEQQDVPSSLYETVSAFDYDTWNTAQSFDLVIGAHSVSEFSYDIFEAYFNKVIRKSNYFFYCYHNFSPSRDLILKKLDTIEAFFIPVVSIVSEGGYVTNCLYKAKSLCD